VAYTEKTPTYEAIQWTGTNQQAIADTIGAWLNTPVGVTLDDTGALVVQHPAGYLSIPASSYFVTGPSWGGHRRDGQDWQVVSPDAFAARFQPQ
jgi:hypothetical protein